MSIRRRVKLKRSTGIKLRTGVGFPSNPMRLRVKQRKKRTWALEANDECRFCGTCDDAASADLEGGGIASHSDRARRRRRRDDFAAIKFTRKAGDVAIGKQQLKPVPEYLSFLRPCYNIRIGTRHFRHFSLLVTVRSLFTCANNSITLHSAIAPSTRHTPSAPLLLPGFGFRDKKSFIKKHK